MIDVAMLGSAAGALSLVIALLFGLAAVARRFDLARRLAQGGATRGGRSAGMPGSRLLCRIDRTRTVSIVELGGFRFAVLSGGVSDRLIVLPARDGAQDQEGAP
ncbi:MAG TPA: hypothetical protein VF286_11330 [Acidiphilium sp.]